MNSEGYPDPTADKAVRRADMPLGDWNLMRSFSCMRYADGSPIEKGHMVYLPGVPTPPGISGVYKVIGFDLRAELVMLQAPNGSLRKADPNEVSRW